MSRKKPADSAVDMDMTPMIDVVFLLIIFFMLVTELSNLDIEDVVLPVAPEAVFEEPQPNSRQVTINVRIKNEETGESEIVVSSQILDRKALTEHLKLEAEVFGQWEPNPKNPTQQNSTLEVLVRGDQHARSSAIHDIYHACQDAKIYRLKIAALSERIGDPYEQ